MVIQFEDVVDTLKCIYGDRFRFLFFFDHSAGHDKLRPNGLNSNQMNKGYGGEQSVMRNSQIKDDTYLGIFNHPDKLKVGDTQSMQYQLGDAGPFYLTPEKREETKYDIETNEI